MNTPPVFLGSILLEPNRWKPGRQPSICASRWSERAAAAGFDGWELWENHYLLADAHEQSSLRNGALPIRVFNSYAGFGEIDQKSAAIPLAVLSELTSVSALKFNVSDDARHIGRCRAAITAARTTLPDGVRLWCECHPGTLLEDLSRLPDFIADGEPWPFDIIIHPFLLGPEKIIHWGKVAGAHIRHAHLQMRDLRDSRKFVALADEPGRVSECLSALAAIGFDGSYTLEFARHTGGVEDIPAVLFEDSVRDLESLRSKFKQTSNT